MQKIQRIARKRSTEKNSATSIVISVGKIYERQIKQRMFEFRSTLNAFSVQANGSLNIFPISFVLE